MVNHDTKRKRDTVKQQETTAFVAQDNASASGLIDESGLYKDRDSQLRGFKFSQYLGKSIKPGMFIQTRANRKGPLSRRKVRWHYVLGKIDRYFVCWMGTTRTGRGLDGGPDEKNYIRYLHRHDAHLKSLRGGMGYYEPLLLSKGSPAREALWQLHRVDLVEDAEYIRKLDYVMVDAHASRALLLARERGAFTAAAKEITRRLQNDGMVAAPSFGFSFKFEAGCGGLSAISRAQAATVSALPMPQPQSGGSRTLLTISEEPSSIESTSADMDGQPVAQIETHGMKSKETVVAEAVNGSGSDRRSQKTSRRQAKARCELPIPKQENTAEGQDASLPNAPQASAPVPAMCKTGLTAKIDNLTTNNTSP